MRGVLVGLFSLVLCCLHIHLVSAARLLLQSLRLPLNRNAAAIMKGLTSVVLLAPASVTAAATLGSITPQQLFEANCSGCHAGGGTVLESSRSLQKKALEKYQYNTIESIEGIIRKGKGRMPAYGEFISPVGNTIPAKLSSSQMVEIAEYVLDEAEKGWPTQEQSATGKNCDVYPGC